MSLSELPDDAIWLRVELHSLKSNATTLEVLTLRPIPATFKDISVMIEEQFDIPVVVQTLIYQNGEVSQYDSPASFYMRSGDTVHVQYPAKGHTRDIKRAIKWLQEITQILNQLKDLTSEQVAIALTNEYKSVVSQDILSRGLFTPWVNPSSEINAIQFTWLGGIELLTTFHRQIIDIRKFKFHRMLKYLLGYLEFVCCNTCANFSMNKECASRLAECGGLNNCTETFLFKSANDDSLRGNNMQTLIEISLRAILNISEIPEVQLKMSERSDVIKQALLAGRTHWFSTKTPVRAVCLLLCVSRCQKAHVNLLTPDLMKDIIALCNDLGIISSPSEFNALRCYAGVAIAQMILGSSHLLAVLPMSTLQSVKKLLRRVCDLNPEDIRQYELKHKLYWETFVACVQYLYEPSIVFPNIDSSDDVTFLNELLQDSIEVLLIYLQSSLGRLIHVTIVNNEGLIDYVTALPWSIPKCFERKVYAVIREVAKEQVIQPPSLASIAKAKLAKNKLGLRKIMDIHSTSELLFLQ